MLPFLYDQPPIPNTLTDHSTSRPSDLPATRIHMLAAVQKLLGPGTIKHYQQPPILIAVFGTRDCKLVNCGFAFVKKQSI